MQTSSPTPDTRKASAGKIGRQISSVLGTIQSLGFFQTVRLLVANYSGLLGSHLIQVKTKESTDSIWLRRGTSDIHVFFQIFGLEEYSVSQFPQYKDLWGAYLDRLTLGQTPIIIDCGANIGLSSLWFARLFPGAHIIAVEPAEDNFAMLKRNIASCSRISAVLAAIRDTNEEVEITNPTAQKWSYQTTTSSPTNPGNAIRSTTMEELLVPYGPDTELLIAKVDIEGGELDLFRSNIEWMRRTDLLIIELHDWQANSRRTSTTFFRAVSGRSIEVCSGGENLFVFFSREKARSHADQLLDPSVMRGDP